VNRGGFRVRKPSLLILFYEDIFKNIISKNMK